MQGGSPILGHCPEVGPPAGAVLFPPPGQEMGLSNTAELHATFYMFASDFCDGCNRRTTCPGIKHTQMFSFTLKTVQVLSAQAALKKKKKKLTHAPRHQKYQLYMQE